MAAYLVVEVSVTDADEYEHYRELAHLAEAQFPEFRLLARGGSGGDDRTDNLEGDWEPELLVIAEFSSHQAAEDFYYSEAYQKALRVREGSAASRAVLISRDEDAL